MPIKLSFFGKRQTNIKQTTTGKYDKFLAIRAPIPASHTGMGYSSAVLIIALAAFAAALAGIFIQRASSRRLGCLPAGRRHVRRVARLRVQQGLGEYNQALADLDLKVGAMHG